MAITREEVLHVARLASLELTDEEVERLTGELSAILEAVSKVSELDLSDVPPTSHPLELVNAWAEAGPTHHAVMAPGHQVDSLKLVAKLFDLELRVIC